VREGRRGRRGARPRWAGKERGSRPCGEKEEGKEGGPWTGGVGKGFRLGLSFFLLFQTLLKQTFKHFLNQTFYTDFSKLFTIILKDFSQTFKDF
jgi:hypothetical protein